MVPVGSDLERNKAVVRRFLEVVSDGGDLSVMDEVCAPGVVNHAARPGLQDGLNAFKQLMAFIHEAQSERRWTQQRYVAEGDFVIVYGVRQGSWHAPEFRGVRIPREGHVSVELAHMFRLSDGLIEEHWAVRDDLAMMQQLGVFDET
jgi:predicted ester cyclase